MAERMTLSFVGLCTIIGGIIFLFVGAWLVIITTNTTVTELNPFFLTPIGIVIALIGVFLIISREEKVGGVLIRAIEPVEGIETMKKNRPGKQLTNLTNGPGKLTQALLIDKSLNGIDATSINSPIYVLENKKRFEIMTSHRIGVTKDLEEKLRFYIKGNLFVSRKKN